MTEFYQSIVVGAGVAGLSAALHLEKAGIKVLILESSDQTGGRINTDEIDGFLLDRGFQVLPSSYKTTSSILNGLKLSSFHSGAMAWDGKRFLSVFDPRRHFAKIFPTLFSGIFTLTDLVRLYFLCRRKSAIPETSSIDALKKLGFSEKSVDLFFKPFLSGVFLEDNLQSSSSFLQFALNNFFYGRAQLPFGGMREIPKNLISQLKKTEVHLNQNVVNILEDGVQLSDGKIVRSETIIIATDAATSQDLLSLPARTNWQSACTLYFSAKRAPFSEPVLYINSSGSGLVNNVAVPSNLTRSYAPMDMHLVSVSLKASSLETSANLIDDVKRELVVWFGSEVLEWSFLKAYKIPKALPICGRIPSLKWYLPKGVFIAGDWLELPSIEHAVISGQSAADNVLQFLAKNTIIDYELAEIKHKIEDIFLRRNLTLEKLPLYRSNPDLGNYYMEKDSAGFHLLAQERGEETFRKSARNRDDFLQLVISALGIK